MLRKFSDGRTDQPTEQQTDESDFVGHYPTKVERRTYTKKIMLFLISI